MIFISILAGIAESRKFGSVWLGIHAGDHHIYPDCRPEFFHKMGDAVKSAFDGGPLLVAPFLRISKGDIVQRGLQLKVPYYMTRTSGFGGSRIETYCRPEFNRKED